MVSPTKAPKAAPPIPLILKPEYAQTATKIRPHTDNTINGVCLKNFLSDLSFICPPLVKNTSEWLSAFLGTDFSAVGNEPGRHLIIRKADKILFVNNYGQGRHFFATPEPATDQPARSAANNVVDSTQNSFSIQRFQ